MVSVGQIYYKIFAEETRLEKNETLKSVYTFSKYIFAYIPPPWNLRVLISHPRTILRRLAGNYEEF